MSLKSRFEGFVFAVLNEELVMGIDEMTITTILLEKGLGIWSTGGHCSFTRTNGDM